MNTKNTAARKLFIGADIFTLKQVDVDDNHVRKDKENRIEVKATLVTPKVIHVNEVKGVKGMGGQDIIIVNGGENKISIPANYQFVEDAKNFDIEKSNESRPQFFADHKSAVEIANAHNTGELIRLQIIKEDLESQIKALKDVINANVAQSGLYSNED